MSIGYLTLELKERLDKLPMATIAEMEEIKSALEAIVQSNSTSAVPASLKERLSPITDLLEDPESYLREEEIAEGKVAMIETILAKVQEISRMSLLEKNRYIEEKLREKAETTAAREAFVAVARSKAAPFLDSAACTWPVEDVLPYSRLDEIQYEVLRLLIEETPLVVAGVMVHDRLSFQFFIDSSQGLDVVEFGARINQAMADIHALGFDGSSLEALEDRRLARHIATYPKEMAALRTYIPDYKSLDPSFRELLLRQAKQVVKLQQAGLSFAFLTAVVPLELREAIITMGQEVSQVLFYLAGSNDFSRIPNPEERLQDLLNKFLLEERVVLINNLGGLYDLRCFVVCPFKYVLEQAPHKRQILIQNAKSICKLLDNINTSIYRDRYLLPHLLSITPESLQLEILQSLDSLENLLSTGLEWEEILAIDPPELRSAVIRNGIYFLPFIEALAERRPRQADEPFVLSARAMFRKRAAARELIAQRPVETRIRIINSSRRLCYLLIQGMEFSEIVELTLDQELPSSLSEAFFKGREIAKESLLFFFKEANLRTFCSLSKEQQEALVCNRAHVAFLAKRMNLSLDEMLALWDMNTWEFVFEYPKMFFALSTCLRPSSVLRILRAIDPFLMDG